MNNIPDSPKVFFLLYKRSWLNSRVHRQAKLFKSLGCEVTVIGLGNHDTPAVEIHPEGYTLLHFYLQPHIQVLLGSVDRFFNRLALWFLGATLAAESRPEPGLFERACRWGLRYGNSTVKKIVRKTYLKTVAKSERLLKTISIWRLGRVVRPHIPAEPGLIFVSQDVYTVPVAWYYRLRRRGAWIHDAVELHWGRVRRTDPGPLSKTIVYLSLNAVSRADAVLAAWPLLKTFLDRRYGVDVQVILNCPNLGADQAAGIDLAHEIKILRDEPGSDLGPNPEARPRKIVVYGGAISAGRGLETVIQSAAHNRDVADYCFFGPGREDYRQSLFDLIRRLGLQDTVFMLGPVPPSAVAPTMSTAQVGLINYASEYENQRLTLSNKLFEYMMAGLPVVINQALTEAARFVEQNQIGLACDTKNPGELAAAIRLLVQDDERLSATQRRARDLSLTYCWENQARRMQAACDPLVKRANADRKAWLNR